MNGSKTHNEPLAETRLLIVSARKELQYRCNVYQIMNWTGVNTRVVHREVLLWLLVRNC